MLVGRRHLLLVTMVLAIASSRFALAQAPPPLTVDNGGGNSSTEGVVVLEGEPGRARIAVRNLHTFWTNLSETHYGVTLRPSSGLNTLGGVQAALGAIAPESAAMWDVEYSTTQPTQISVTTTPYLFTETGGLSAALNILHIAIRMLGGNDDYLSKGVNRGLDMAERIPQAAQLVQGVFGDKIAKAFTKESLVSGQLARDIFDTLSDTTKAKVVQEALALLGVTASVKQLQDLVGWFPAVSLFELVWDMGSAIILSRSSGGVVFSSLPPIVTTSTTTSSTSTTLTTTTSTGAPPSSFVPPIVQDPSLPAAPSGLVGDYVRQGNVSITFTWVDNSDNETGFRIYYDGRLLGTATANATFLAIRVPFQFQCPAETGQSDLFEIEAYNDSGTSERYGWRYTCTGG